METPVINKSQKKSTLSAKKTKTKETIKNIIATPYKKSYWPLISPEDHETLRMILENNLPRIKPCKVNVPWKILKNTPKIDRKKIRDKYLKKDQFQVDKKDRDGLSFGINEVTKKLENNLVSVILIASDVQPRIMVQHLIDAAVLHKVPIIIFENLKNLLSKICGISGAALSINKDISAGCKLGLVKESIEQVFEKYPPPLDHINYSRSQKTVDNKESNVKDIIEVVDLTKSITDLVEEEKSMDTSEHVEDKDNNENATENESSFFLIRETTTHRVFVPERSQENVRVVRVEVDSTGFLPFLDTPTPQPENKSVKTNYKSLIVKRLKGDPNRNKRKIERLKRKSK